MHLRNTIIAPNANSDWSFNVVILDVGKDRGLTSMSPVP
jgi:hypothetical protein